MAARHVDSFPVSKILVIEDDSQVRRIIALVLERAGHAVTTACHGMEGIKRNREDPAELIVTDIFMPEEDGLGVIMTLRKENRTASILAISGGNVGQPNWLEVAARIGATRTLAKPFVAGELVGIVTQMLAERAAIQELAQASDAGGDVAVAGAPAAGGVPVRGNLDRSFANP